MELTTRSPAGAATALDVRTGGWTRGSIAAFVALVVGATLSLFWLVHPYFEPVNDAAIYMLTAKALAAGEGYSYLGQPFIIRPPGFSVLIAPIVATRGFDFGVLHGFVSLWGVAGIALLFLYMRPRIGPIAAFALCVCVWLNPGYRALSNQVMSDVPGTALFVGCLLLERWARARPSTKRDVVLALAIGLAAYVRSVTVLLVPAIVIARVVGHWRKRDETLPWPRFALARLLPLAIVPALVLAPWSVRNARHHPPTPVDQTSLFSYSTGMWNVDRGDPDSAKLPLASVAARIPVRFHEIFSTLGTRMRESTSKPLDVAIGCVLFAVALVTLLRRNDPTAYFIGGVVAVVLVYFSYQDRLMLPVFLIVLIGVAEALVGVLRRVVDVSIGEGIVAALLLVLAFVDFAPRENWERIRAEHEAFAKMNADIAPKLAPDARIAAPMRGWYYSMFLDRPVYSLYFAWDRERTTEAVERVIDKYDIDTVVLTPLTETDRILLPYFAKRYPHAQQVGQAVVVRVRE